MELKQALVESFVETLAMFGKSAIFQSEMEIEHLESASQVNVLIGLTMGAHGNVVLGLDETVALKLASAMMGGAEVAEIDSIVQSALGELLNMVLGSALQKIGPSNLIDISPPTLVTGSRITLMISRVRSYKLLFTMDDETYHISFSVE